MNLIRDPRVMFKEVFNLGKTRDEQFKKLITDIPVPEMDRKVGKPIELTNRTIYPIIQTFVTVNEGQDFIAIEIFPIALVVKEKDNEYVISLTKDEINLEEIIKMTYSNEV